jgi:transcriptional regulator with XRE-family HTH domain
MKGKRDAQRPKGTAQFFLGLATVTRETREREEMSQRELARRAGISHRLVADIEAQRANPSVTRLHRLAKGLGLSGYGELVALADEAAPSSAE